MSLLLLGLVSLGQAAPLLVLDFDTSDGGMTPSGEPLQWEWGEVAADMGPGSGWAGPRAWATRLDAPTMHEADDVLGFPSVSLDVGERPVLRLVHWFDIARPGDLGRVELWQDDAWHTLAPVYGYPEPGGFAGASDGWVEHWFDLSEVSDTAELRLRFTSDATGAAPGWVVGGAEVLVGDPVPPSIRVVEGPADTSALDSDHGVQVEVVDDLDVQEVVLVWIADGGERVRTPLSNTFDDRWSGSIPLQSPGTAVVWWVTASDGANTATTAAQSFRVFLPGPTELTGPGERTISTTVPLQWSPPDLDDPVQSYRIWRADTLVAESTIPEAAAPAEGPIDAFSVSAMVRTPMGTFESDRSDTLLVAVSVPELRALHPSRGWQGDRLRIEISGEYVLLADDRTTVDLGPGIEIDSLTVTDATRLVVEATIAPDAATGSRDLTVRSGEIVARAPASFSVSDGASRPRLLELRPAELVLGEQDTFRLQLSAPPESLPSIDLGEGVIIESIQPVDPTGTVLELSLVAAPDAEPGTRELVADDGVRELRGVQLEVRQPTRKAGRVCGTRAGAAGALWLIAALGALARRRGDPRPEPSRPLTPPGTGRPPLR